MSEPVMPPEGATRVRARYVFAGFLLGALVMTWPLVLHLRTRLPSTWGDSKITAWVVAWDAHAIVHEPTRLFQAPVFAPEADTLGYTDHNITDGLAAVPFMLVFRNAYLAYNAVFLLNIAFSGTAAWLAARRLWGDDRAAVIAGAAFAFAPYWFGHTIHLSHIQIISAGWLPLSVYGFLRWVNAGGVKDAAILAACVTGSLLTSWYLGIFDLISIGVLAAVCLAFRRPPRPARSFLALGAAAAVGVLVVFPFVRPYQRVHERLPNFTRTVEQVRQNSALASSFLSAPADNVVYGGVTKSFRERQRSIETDLFPGVIVVAAASSGTVWAIRDRRRRATVIALLAVAAVGVALSLGVGDSGSLWGLLFDRLSVFRSLRAAARANIMVMLAMSILAGGGAALLLSRTKRKGLVTAILVGLLALEGSSVPLALGTAVQRDAVYRAIPRDAVVLELPMGVSGRGKWIAPWTRDVDAMMRQIGFRWRLANGGLGYVPPSYSTLLDAALDLPEPAAMDLLRGLGVRIIVLHLDDVGRTPWVDLDARLHDTSGVRVLARSPKTAIWELR